MTAAGSMSMLGRKNLMRSICGTSRILWPARGGTHLQSPAGGPEPFSRLLPEGRTAVSAAGKRAEAAEPGSFQSIWYNGRDGSNVHYHASRYHALNLHSVFQKGTVEFRMFNSTLHAGKVKTYIQFSLAIANQALTQRNARAAPTRARPMTGIRSGHGCCGWE